MTKRFRNDGSFGLKENTDPKCGMFARQKEFPGGKRTIDREKTTNKCDVAELERKQTQKNGFVPSPWGTERADPRDVPSSEWIKGGRGKPIVLCNP